MVCLKDPIARHTEVSDRFPIDKLSTVRFSRSGVNRHKACLDFIPLRDESGEELDKLPNPAVLIVIQLTSESFNVSYGS